MQCLNNMDDRTKELLKAAKAVISEFNSEFGHDEEVGYERWT